MKYKGLKIGVFHDDRLWVEDWFREFIKKYGESCISQCAFTKGRLFLILKDGTQIISCPATENSRGHKFDKVYIQPTIRKEIIDNIIAPMVWGSHIVIEDF